MEYSARSGAIVSSRKSVLLWPDPRAPDNLTNTDVDVLEYSRCQWMLPPQMNLWDGFLQNEKLAEHSDLWHL